MRDDAFEPYVPRRWRASPPPQPVDARGASAPQEVTAVAAIDDMAAAVATAAPDAPPSEALASEALASDSPCTPPSDAIAQIGDSSDDDRIREAAIELAAVACTRALRYALDRNPRLLARFVDDALQAAGAPERAVIRVAASHAHALGVARAHEIIAEEGLSPGDVFIECAAGTVGATVAERAAQLVRSAAA